MRSTLAQLRVELVLVSRQGEQLLVSLGIPVLVLLFVALVDLLPAGDGDPLATLVPAVLALGIMSSAMVALGIGTGFERYYGVLKRLGSTPLGRPRLVAAKVASVLVLEAVQLAVLVPVGLALGWEPSPRLGLLVVAYVVGTAAFSGIGLVLAGTLRASLNLAVTNALYLVLLFFGGIAVPASALPTTAETLVTALPSGALAAALGQATGATDLTVGPWLALGTWAVAAVLAAAAWFRWE